jgi:hypothetical protein
MVHIIKHFSRTVDVLFCIAYFCLILPPFAYSYLDLGTGSYIIQMIIAGLLSPLFLIKSVRSRIIDFFSKFFKKNRKK